MSSEPNDYSRLLREAISEASAAGLRAEVKELERVTLTAYTLSSELLGEQGRSIQRVLKSGNGRLPGSTRSRLEACLREVAKVWPSLGK